MLLVDVTPHIHAFARMLTAAWPSVEELATLHPNPFEGVEIANPPRPIDDWLEASWELLLEPVAKSLHRHATLALYGRGASIYGDHSRILHTTQPPTHHVVCLSRQDDATALDVVTGHHVELPRNGLQLLELVCPRGRTFDHVRLRYMNWLVPLDELRFAIRAVTPDEE